jgi:hypothetical protein
MVKLMRIGMAVSVLAAPAHALTPENRTCEMPGVGQAAFVTGFDNRYALFDWWDKTGDSLGDHAVIYADCQGAEMLRATTTESSDKYGAATEILWTAGKAGQGGDLDALAKALEGAGFAVARQSLAADHCACAPEMIAE